jgi:Prokaryotic N-terminal methylation motif
MAAIVMHQPHRNTGFSVVEVMVATTILVVGLLAVASSTITTQMIRKRSLDEDTVFRGMTACLEQCRGDLYRDTEFHDAVQAALAGGDEYQGNFILDLNGDGEQDVSQTAGDQDTPVLTVNVVAAEPTDDPNVLVEVTISATWYGVGGQRTRTIRGFVANRTGYEG